MDCRKPFRCEAVPDASVMLSSHVGFRNRGATGGADECCVGRGAIGFVISEMGGSDWSEEPLDEFLDFTSPAESV